MYIIVYGMVYATVGIHIFFLNHDIFIMNKAENECLYNEIKSNKVDL